MRIEDCRFKVGDTVVIVSPEKYIDRFGHFPGGHFPSESALFRYSGSICEVTEISSVHGLYRLMPLILKINTPPYGTRIFPSYEVEWYRWFDEQLDPCDDPCMNVDKDDFCDIF